MATQTQPMRENFPDQQSWINALNQFNQTGTYSGSTPTQTTTSSSPMTKVLDPAALGYYTEGQINRQGSDIFLNPGVAPQGDPNLYQTIQQPTSAPIVNVPEIISQNDFDDINNANTIVDSRQRANNAMAEFQDIVNQFSQIQPFNPQEQFNRLAEQSGLAGLQQQYTDTQNAIRSLESDLQARYTGRDISESEFQAELASRSEPLLRQRQYLADQIGNIQSNIQQQIQYGQQGFTNRFNQMLQTIGLRQDIMAGLKSDLENQLEAARQGRLDDINLALTLMEIPEGQSITLSDGTVLQGTGRIAPNVRQITETDRNGNVTVVGIDETTGEILYSTDLGQIGKGFKGSGGGGGDGDGFSNVTSADIGQVQSVLRLRTGADGFVDTQVYSGLSEQWKQKFGIGEFEKEFPPENYLNPSDPTARKFLLTGSQQVTAVDKEQERQENISYYVEQIQGGSAEFTSSEDVPVAYRADVKRELGEDEEEKTPLEKFIDQQREGYRTFWDLIN